MVMGIRMFWRVMVLGCCGCIRVMVLGVGWGGLRLGLAGTA
jgi:hypothetical protein